MSSPVAVLIADVHYSMTTLPLAEAAMRQAIAKANDLGIPLIVAGDLHETKANLRGECVKAMLETFELCDERPYVIIGNHCRINERSKEHSLNFLKHACNVTNHPVFVREVGSWLIPYYSDPSELRTILEYIEKPARLIMHQGVTDTNSGHYIQDKSALPKEVFADFRVISGHYHMAQDLKCGRPRKGAVGLFSYIGNPYTLNFAEANDPSKGFAVLYEDGFLERIPTNLRKHVVIETCFDRLTSPLLNYTLGDLVWLKVRGPRSELAKINKIAISRSMFYGDLDFKLDLIPTDAPILEAKTENMTGAEILDALIDNEPETADEKSELKKLWRDLCA